MINENNSKNTAMFGRRGFSLIELMVVVLIMSYVLATAAYEYIAYVDEAKFSRARTDLEELVKSVRLFNIRESRTFDIATFSPEDLGSFVGTYLEKEPGKDPWGNFYLHSKDQGVVFSTGPDGQAQTLSVATDTDDVVVSYLPKRFFIARAEYVDANLNNIVDFGDYIELRFSRPAVINQPMVVDFYTEAPAKALGSAVVERGDNEYHARIIFAPPFAPDIKPGETRIFPREFITSIVDMSPEPGKLERLEGVIIEKRKK